MIDDLRNCLNCAHLKKNGGICEGIRVMGRYIMCNRHLWKMDRYLPPKKKEVI